MLKSKSKFVLSKFISSINGGLFEENESKLINVFNIESKGLIIKLDFVLLDKIDINIGVISILIYLFIS